MDQLEYCDAITAASGALADVARRAPETVVPTCAPWSVGRLALHVGSALRWAGAILTEDVRDAEGAMRVYPHPGDDEDPAAWLERTAAELVAVLRAADPETPAWTGARDGRVIVWARRMAHETAIHRWDAQRAVGDPEPIGSALALDGVEEVFANIDVLPRAAELVGQGETLHLHATDATGEWLLTLTPSGLAVDRAHAKGAVAVRASASDLDLLLWGRVDPEAVEVFGDRGLLDRFLAIISF